MLGVDGWSEYGVYYPQLIGFICLFRFYGIITAVSRFISARGLLKRSGAINSPSLSSITFCLIDSSFYSLR